MALQGHIVSQIPALKSRYALCIPGPRRRGIQMTGALYFLCLLTKIIYQLIWSPLSTIILLQLTRLNTERASHCKIFKPIIKSLVSFLWDIDTQHNIVSYEWDWSKIQVNILNKSENATPELFATYIQNYANQECNWKCILMSKYCVMHNSKSFTDVVTRKHMKAI